MVSPIPRFPSFSTAVRRSALSLLVDDLQQSRAGVFDDDLKHLPWRQLVYEARKRGRDPFK